MKAITEAFFKFSSLLIRFARYLSKTVHRHPIPTVLIVPTLAIAGFLVFIWVVPSPPPFMVIVARSQIVEQRVVLPQTMRIPLYSSKPRRLEGACDPLLDTLGRFSGLLEPGRRAIVTYRIIGSRVAISVRAQEGAETNPRLINDAGDCEIGDAASFLIDTADKESVNAMPLPIAGPTAVGQDSRGDNNLSHDPWMLVSGEVRVFGRTLFGRQGGALYPGGDAIPLVAGSRVTSLKKWRSPAVDAETAWFGYATSAEGVFEVSATTEARDLEIFRPGGRRDNERLSPANHANLLNDPSVAFLSLAFALLTVLVQSVATVLALHSRVPSQPKEADN